MRAYERKARVDVTPARRQQVLALKKAEPDLTQDAIARRVGLSQGAVGRILREAGQRVRAVPPEIEAAARDPLVAVQVALRQSEIDGLLAGEGGGAAGEVLARQLRTVLALRAAAMAGMS